MPSKVVLDRDGEMAFSMSYFVLIFKLQGYLKNVLSKPASEGHIPFCDISCQGEAVFHLYNVFFS